MSSRLRRAVVAAVAALAAQLVAVPSALAVQAVAASPDALPAVLDGAVEAIAVSGDTVYVGGTFATLRLPDSSTITQPYLFAYSLSTGALITSFRPVVDGEVSTLAAASDGVFAGGTFLTVDGAARRRLAKIAPDGRVDPTFVADATLRVDSLALSGNRLFVGGQFGAVRGVTRSLLAEVDARTGAVAAGFNLPITGSAAPGGFTTTVALDVSPDGRTLLVAHNGLRVAGQDRVGLALVDISGPTALLLPWRTRLWSDALPAIGGLVRITGAAFGPDGSWFVVSNTGGDRPPTNDSIQRFDVAAALPAQPTWVTRQFDSSYAITVGPNGAVYTGGHFRYTEAPGSTEPYPGLPTVNYGFGPAGGARVLGSQVVGRQQLDALDPVTGKALNWYGGADGQHGVTALVVAGDRLLVGQDGQRVGGVSTGAHGLLRTYGAPVDPDVPHSSLTSPLAGAVLPPGTLHLSGSATAPAGVGSVTVEVTRPGQSGYLRADGTWGTWYAFPATLDADGNWSLDVTLADGGDYLIRPKATGLDGAAESAQPTPVEVYDTTATPPTVAVTFPASGQQDFTGHTLTVRGTAADPDGVAAVTISAYNTTAQAYSNGSGGTGDYMEFDATLDHPGATSVTWSVTLTLSDGAYTLNANAVDTRGIALPEPVRSSFIMAPGNSGPGIRIISPSSTTSVTTSAVTLSGSGYDRDGVARVLVLVRDARFGLGPAVGTAWGVANWVPARLSGTTSVTWSLSVSLPAGTYLVTAYAEDRMGLTTPLATRATSVIRRWPAGVTIEPSTALTSPLSSTRFSTLAMPMSGTATDAHGISQVLVSLYDTIGQGFLQADGSLGRLPALRPARLASPGATSTAWSLTVTLPRASYWRVDAVAVNRLGAVDSSYLGSRAAFPVYPGDADPTATLTSPARGAVISGRVVVAGGRAFDDHGVASVLIYLRRSDGIGVQANGTVGTAPAWVRAYVTNPGGPATNWQYTSPTLPPGTWTLYARPVDSVGKGALTYPSVTVTVK